MNCHLTPLIILPVRHTRRIFSRCAWGIGAAALASLLRINWELQRSSAASNPPAPKAPHYTPKAKRVVTCLAARRRN